MSDIINPSNSLPNPPPGPSLNYALWADRFLAALIDAAIVFFFAAILMTIVWVSGFAVTAATAAGQTNDQNLLGPTMCCCGTFVVVPISMLIIGLFNKVYLIHRRGSSIGQGFMKLRVTNTNGQPLTFGKLVLRLLIQVGFGFVAVVQLLDLLWPLWDIKRQTLHDKAVNSVVIKNS
jgi:uncharacterized RDD family membrane protein YckC